VRYISQTIVHLNQSKKIFTRHAPTVAAKVKGFDTEFDERPCHGLPYKRRWNVGGGIGGAEL
jgi:hypothetical protein